MLRKAPISHQRGAVALLTSIIISILLAIIVTGLVTLMTSELRQANDAEQSARAYYAAQSGVEDGVQYVLSQLAIGQPFDRSCTATTISTAVGWTCQKITGSGMPTGTLDVPDQATQIDLDGAPDFDQVVVSWDTADPKLTDPNYYKFPVGPPLPASGSWSGAAAMEMTIVDYPATDTVTQSNIRTQNLLAVPNIGGKDTPDLSTLTTTAANPYLASCIPGKTSTPYHCSITITGFDAVANRYIIRLRTRYSGTSYQLSFSKKGAAVSVPDGSATIDVTAHAGDVYRRVIYKIPYKDAAASGLNFVLYTDNNVCKNYSIVGGFATSTYPCPLN